MHTARIPPVDPAPATITAVLAMHAGHICPSSELLIRPRLSGGAALPLDAGYVDRQRVTRSSAIVTAPRVPA
jgi:hypothetical protein